MKINCDSVCLLSFDTKTIHIYLTYLVHSWVLKSSSKVSTASRLGADVSNRSVCLNPQPGLGGIGWCNSTFFYETIWKVKVVGQESGGCMHATLTELLNSLLKKKYVTQIMFFKVIVQDSWIFSNIDEMIFFVLNISN